MITIKNLIGFILVRLFTMTFMPIMSVWKRPTTAVYGTLTVVAGLRSDVNYVSLINPYIQMWTFFLKCFYFMQNSKGRPTVATGQWPTEGRDHLALNENVCILCWLQKWSISFTLKVNIVCFCGTFLMFYCCTVIRCLQISWHFPFCNPLSSSIPIFVLSHSSLLQWPICWNKPGRAGMVWSAPQCFWRFFLGLPLLSILLILLFLLALWMLSSSINI